MKKQKSIELNGKLVVINELSLKQIREIYEFVNENKGKTINDLIKSGFPKFLNMSSNLTYEQIFELDFTPSDLKQLYDVFSEVNTDFLLGMKKLKLNAMIEQVIPAIAGVILSTLLQGLSGQGIPKPQSMG